MNRITSNCIALCVLGLAASLPSVAESLAPYGALVAADVREKEAAPDTSHVVENALAASSRIVNGTRVTTRKYPWMVAIGYFNDKKKLVQYCGGTVVGAGWVLTAAHCPLKKDHAAIALELNLRGVTEPSAVIKGLFRGPYNEHTRDADYALIRLDHDLEIAPLAINRDPQIESIKNTELTIAGWGVTRVGGHPAEVLMHARIKTDDVSSCAGTYNLAGYQLTSTMFCAWAQRTDACYGDSGGPAFREITTGAYELVGVVSWGRDCAQWTSPGVYTRGSAIAQWIDDTLKKCPPASKSLPPANAQEDPCWNI